MFWTIVGAIIVGLLIWRFIPLVLVFLIETIGSIVESIGNGFRKMIKSSNNKLTKKSPFILPKIFKEQRKKEAQIFGQTGKIIGIIFIGILSGFLVALIIALLLNL